MPFLQTEKLYGRNRTYKAYPILYCPTHAFIFSTIAQINLCIVWHFALWDEIYKMSAPVFLLYFF